MIALADKPAKRHAYSSFDKRDARVMLQESSAGLRDRSVPLRSVSALLRQRNRDGRREVARLRLVVDDLRALIDDMARRTDVTKIKIEDEDLVTPWTQAGTPPLRPFSSR